MRQQTGCLSCITNADIQFVRMANPNKLSPDNSFSSTFGYVGIIDSIALAYPSIPNPEMHFTQASAVKECLR